MLRPGTASMFTFRKGPLYIIFFTTGVFIFAEKITKSHDASPNAGVLFNPSFP